jgi:hypothetical protein
MAIALLFDGQLGVGYWLYKVFPCEDVWISFPCYWYYSVYLFLFLVWVFILSVGYILELKRKLKQNLPIKPISIVLTVFWQVILAIIVSLVTMIVLFQILKFLLN